MRKAAAQLAAVALSASALGFLVPPGAPAQETVTLPARDRPLSASPLEMYSVGSFSGEEWQLFGGRVSVVFDDEGDLYILDAVNFRVVVLNRRGEFERSFGKQGGGPGELRSPIAMAIEPDGRVVILDIGRGGYSVFDKDGTFVENALYDMAEGLPISRRIYGRADGVLTELQPGIEPEAGEIPSAEEMSRRWLIVDPLSGGGKRHSLFEFSPRAPGTQTRGGSAGEATLEMTGPPEFTPDLRWSAWPDGSFALAAGAGYEIEVHDPSGALVRRIHRPIVPRRITQRDRAAYKKQRRKELQGGGRPGALMVRVESESGSGTSVSASGGGGLPPETVARMLKSMKFSSVRPAIRGLVADPAGRIWVRRDGRKIGSEGPIDLVTRKGRYLGSLDARAALPEAFGPHGLVAYVSRDSLDVTHVTVARLPAALR